MAKKDITDVAAEPDIHPAIIFVSSSLVTLISPSAGVMVYAAKVHLHRVAFPLKHYKMEKSPQMVWALTGALGVFFLTPLLLPLFLTTLASIYPDQHHYSSCFLKCHSSQCALLLKVMCQSQWDLSFIPTFGSIVFIPVLSLSILRLWNPEVEQTLTSVSHPGFKLQ